LEYNAKTSFENLREVWQKYNLAGMEKTVSLIVDDGPENKGEVTEFVMQPGVNIEKLIAQKDIIFSNSMIEAANKHLKYGYLFTRDFHNPAELFRNFGDIVFDYNSKPHYALYGLSPSEAAAGIIPDKHLFSSEIETARIMRKAENMTMECPECMEGA
jgi:putative transposase